jgi:hypothetical protein
MPKQTQQQTMGAISRRAAGSAAVHCSLQSAFNSSHRAKAARHLILPIKDKKREISAYTGAQKLLYVYNNNNNNNNNKAFNLK